MLAPPRSLVGLARLIPMESADTSMRSSDTTDSEAAAAAQDGGSPAASAKSGLQRRVDAYYRALAIRLRGGGSSGSSSAAGGGDGVVRNGDGGACSDNSAVSSSGGSSEGDGGEGGEGGVDSEHEEGDDGGEGGEGGEGYVGSENDEDDDDGETDDGTADGDRGSTGPRAIFEASASSGDSSRSGRTPGGNHAGDQMVGVEPPASACGIRHSDAFNTAAAEQLGFSLRLCSSDAERSAATAGAVTAVCRAAHEDCKNDDDTGEVLRNYPQDMEAAAYEHLLIAVGSDGVRQIWSAISAAAKTLSYGHIAQLARRIRWANRPGAFGESGLSALSYLLCWRQMLVAADFWSAYRKFATRGFAKWSPNHFTKFLFRAATVGRVINFHDLAALLVLTGQRRWPALLLSVFLALAPNAHHLSSCT